MMDTLFIVSDTYQAMQAVEWACSNDTHVHLFCINPQLKLNPTSLVTIYNISYGDLFRTSDNVVNTKLSHDQYAYFKLIYSTDTEIHTFGDLDLFFKLGMTEVHLHETGDSSYKINQMSRLYGEDDPFTVNTFHMISSIDDNDEEKTMRIEHNDIFSNIQPECKQHIARVLGVKIPETTSNTVLYVHNEPDGAKYSEQQVQDIHDKVGRLLADIKGKGYTLWVKDHHKRPGGIDLSPADVVVDCPVELLDTSKFVRVVSVRSKCLEHINGNCYNGLTQQAVTKSNGDFYNIYCRGIEKIYRDIL